MNYQQEESLPNNCSRPKPTFWAGFDDFVQAANDHGMLVFVSGIMEPVGGMDTDYPGDIDLPRDPVDEDRYPRYAPAKVFARYMASRYSGNHVVLSPGFDSGPRTSFDQNNENVLELMKQTGQELNRVAPDLMLHSNHWGTVSTSQMLTLQNESWLDFQMLQSGANFGAPGGENGRLQRTTERARLLPPTLLNDSTASSKGVINGEGPYDDGEPIPFSTPPTFHRNDFRARQVGHLSWLNGAFGYTTGIGGLWDWSLCSLANRPSYCSEYRPRNPGYDQHHEGLAKSSAAQMSHLGKLMKTVAPYNGRTATHITYEQNRIKNQPADTEQQRKMATLRDPWALQVYLPRNDYVMIGAQGIYGDPSRNRWWNVRSGQYETYVAPPIVRCPVGQACAVDLNFCLENPSQCSYCGTFGAELHCAFKNFRQNPEAVEGANDFVLEIELSTPGYLSGWAGTSTLDLRAYAGIVEGMGSWGIYGDLRASTGEAVVKPFRIDSLLQSKFPRSSVASRDGHDNFVVAWQDDADADGFEEIYARFVGPTGSLGALVRVSPVEQSDNLAPAVAMDNGGRSFIVWNRRSSLGSTVLAASLDSGEPQASPPVEIGGGESPYAWSPTVASTPCGAVTVAWTETEPLELPRILYAQLDGDLQFTAGTAQLGGVDAEQLTPIRSYVGTDGTVTVEWEALGGSVAAARRKISISPTEGPEALETTLATWGFDAPTPPLESEDSLSPWANQ